MNRVGLIVRLRLAGLVLGVASLLSGCGLGSPCGGLDGAVCEADLFCWYPVGVCGEGDQIGVCIPRPEACVQIFAPVCGCDGQTYSNDCVAFAAGVSVRHEGECNGQNGDQVCGGIVGAACDDGEYCRLPDGQCCCDIQGVCTPMPEVCPELFAPVCGCDGQTYGNACEAAAAGVSVQSQGECPEDDGSGGGPG